MRKPTDSKKKPLALEAVTIREIASSRLEVIAGGLVGPRTTYNSRCV